ATASTVYWPEGWLASTVETPIKLLPDGARVTPEGVSFTQDGRGLSVPAGQSWKSTELAGDFPATAATGLIHVSVTLAPVTISAGEALKFGFTSYGLTVKNPLINL